MSYSILFNPMAGHGTCEEKAKELADKLGGAKLVDITKINDYAEFFSAIGAGDAVIICGGDGTLNRFINATDGIEIPCDILYSAQGSGNDFLRDIEKSADGDPIKINQYIKNLPSVTVNGKSYRFLNNVGFGIDGYCCEVGDAKKAKGETNINYTSIAIMGLLFHFKPKNATVVVDGKEFSYKKVWIAPTMKGRFYGGGMMPTPAQNRLSDDGKLSLMLFYGKGKLKTLMVSISSTPIWLLSTRDMTSRSDLTSPARFRSTARPYSESQATGQLQGCLLW